MAHDDYTAKDFAHSPFVVFYELTRACDLVCRHCRACAQPTRDPQELSTEQANALIAQLTQFPKPPMLVLTGGDPMKRPDLSAIIEHAVASGLEVSITPSATPLVTPQAIRALRDAGIGRLALSLDGACAETHDAFRGVKGSFDRTLEILADARSTGIPFQVNTTLTRRNVGELDDLAELLQREKSVLWSAFFLVPMGRGAFETRLLPEEYEIVFERLWHHARRQPYAIKTTEAPHYRRYVAMQRRSAACPPVNRKHKAGIGDPGFLSRQCHPAEDGATVTKGRLRRGPLGINDGKGTMFVSHIGEVFPSGFLPILCGQFPQNSVIDVYQRSETFCALRDPDRLGGKCGVCEYRHICGGSRARAYAVTGDPLAAEPDCSYVPQPLRC